MAPVVVQAAVHEGGQDPEGEALQVAPHHIATVSDQVQQAAQHGRPHLRALLVPLQYYTQMSGRRKHW